MASPTLAGFSLKPMLPRHEIRALQGELLRKQVERVWTRIPYYRERWERAGVTPEQIQSVSDIVRLPIITKKDLEEDFRDNPPFGSFQGDFPAIRVQSSSGSTGKLKPILHTRNDWELITDLWARRLANQGVVAGDRVQVAFTYSLFIPGFTSTEGAMKLGAMVIPTGSGAATNSLQQLQLAREWGSTVLGCTGGYALHLASIAAEHGMNPKRDFKFRVMYHTSEPLVEEARQRIQDIWGVKAYNNYGSVETGAPAWECTEQNGMHFNEDAYIFEIVDSQTLEPLPDGEEGAIVLTCLSKEAGPVIRYLIGDIGAIWAEPCACGCTFRRIGPIRGRLDDMLKIRGVAVYPTAIEAALRKFSELGQEFRIIVDRKDGADTVEVQVELAQGALHTNGALSEAIRDAIKHQTRCTAVVTLHSFGSLALPEDVAKRVKNRYVVDLRNKQ